MLKIELKGQCSLEEIKKDYLAKVAKWSEEELSKLSTLNQGKVYDHKYEEALSLVRGEKEKSIWLENEAKLKGINVLALAHAVIGAREEWERRAVEIENKRMNTGMAIKQGKDKSELYRLMKKGGFF